MGKSSRAKRIRRFDKIQRLEPIEEPIEVHVVDNVQIVEEQSVTNDSDITDVMPTMKQPSNKQVTTSVSNPNSANVLLNSIFTTLLTQEYNRLHQQLMNIKRQLDEQKVITGELIEEKDIIKNDQTEVYNKSI